MTDFSESPNPPPARKGLTVILCLGLAVAATAVIWWIVNTQPEAERSTETRRTAMLVKVTTVTRGSYRPQIVALGRVDPARQIQLRAQVRGQVIERASAFDPGGHLAEGAPLLKLQPADFDNAVRQRRSELAQARADLRLEMGRQTVAESDLDLLRSIDTSLPDLDPDLVLREPQLDAARARIAFAEAAVDQALLDLERTEIVAPFPAQVLERNVDVGSQVAPGQNLGRLVGTGQYWISASVPLRALEWIDFSSAGSGTPVKIRNRSAWPDGVVRTGRVGRLVGSLNEETRLGRILITVDDPLATDSPDLPPLMLGSVVECTLSGKEMEDVVRIDRSLLRGGGTVWVMDDEDRLRIAEVEVRFKDARHAYVSTGLEDGERIVTTDLASVTDGAPLRLKGGGE